MEKIFFVLQVSLLTFCDGLSSICEHNQDFNKTDWHAKASLASNNFWENHFKNDFGKVCENGIQELQLNITHTTASRISLSSFIDFQAVNSGNYGKVLSARHEYSRQRFAIKIMDLNPFREVEFLKLLSHKNVIKYEHSWEEKTGDLDSIFPGVETLYVIQMELCTGNNVADWITNVPVWMKTETDAKKIILQSLLGLEHIHSKGIVHRDLKPANILLKTTYKMNQTDLHVKIADFGTAVDLSEISQLTNSTSVILAGTPFYMSPEQERMEGSSYDSTTDIYSMGLIFYEVLMSSFTDNLDESLAEDLRIRKAILPKLFVDKFTEENKLIKLMLSENPCYRPTASYIIMKLKDLWQEEKIEF